ncbi:MAG: hypothetical protein ACI8XO_004695 [Verrucomicrobiales bacterium]
MRYLEHANLPGKKSEFFQPVPHTIDDLTIWLFETSIHYKAAARL